MADMLLAEAAAALGVSVDTIRRRVKRGELAHHTDSQGRIVVHLANSVEQMPSSAQHAAVQAAEQMLGTAEQVAEQVAEQRWAAAEHGAMQSRLEGLQQALDLALSETSFLRDELRRRDQQAEREREQHAQERDALHQRLHEALAALAIQRALPSGKATTTPNPPATASPLWWVFWRRWRSSASE
jgi:chromosome segregation ATPase